MQRSFLRLSPSQQATAAVAALTARTSRLSPPCSALLRVSRSGRTLPSVQLARCSLLAAQAHYATAPPPGHGKEKEGEELHDDTSAAAASPAGHSGYENGGSSGAIDFASAPSLRDALPPSAVDLPETSFLKCIEKEMMDEKYRLDKEEGPPQVPVGWTMHHTEGSSFIYGRRVWLPPPSASAQSSATARASGDGGADDAAEEKPEPPAPRAVEKHFLRLQLTTRDASLDPECDVRGEHFPFSFFVQRVRSEEAEGGDDKEGKRGASGGANIDLDGDAFEEHSFYHDSVEVRCDVVDGELVIDNVVYHGSSGTSATAVDGATRPHHANPFGGYPGPNLDEAEEEVLDGLQSWLAERGVDDQLGEFMGQYAIWIEQAEYETWLQQLHDYVAA